MPLNIKDSESHALAKLLASLTGEPLTQAVKLAIQQRLAQAEKTHGTTGLADKLDEIALHCAGLPSHDRRNAEQIIGYDESGLPV